MKWTVYEQNAELLHVNISTWSNAGVVSHAFHFQVINLTTDAIQLKVIDLVTWFDSRVAFHAGFINLTSENQMKLVKKLSSYFWRILLWLHVTYPLLP